MVNSGKIATYEVYVKQVSCEFPIVSFRRNFSWIYIHMNVTCKHNFILISLQISCQFLFNSSFHVKIKREFHFWLCSTNSRQVVCIEQIKQKFLNMLLFSFLNVCQWCSYDEIFLWNVYIYITNNVFFHINQFYSKITQLWYHEQTNLHFGITFKLNTHNRLILKQIQGESFW